MRSLSRWFIIYLMAAGAFAACDRPAPAPPPSPILGTIGDDEVTLAEFRPRLHEAVDNLGDMAPTERAAFRALARQVLEEYVEQRLLLREAERRGLTVTDAQVAQQRARLLTATTTGAAATTARDADPSASPTAPTEPTQTEPATAPPAQAFPDDALRERMLINALLNDAVASQVRTPDEETLRRYWEDHQAEFAHGPALRIRQILVDSEEEGEAIRRAWRRGKDAGLIARDETDAVVGPNGNVAVITVDDIPEEFRETLTHLAVGRVSKLFKSSYGYQVFRLEGKLPEGVTPFDDVRDQIAAHLLRQRQEDAYHQWFNHLQTSTPIHIFPDADMILEGEFRDPTPSP